MLRRLARCDDRYGAAARFDSGDGAAERMARRCAAFLAAPLPCEAPHLEG